ncbi:nuclear transcription factor Y subunit C-6 [Neltuma alba]|uniref:nuclear transcription factor Y subunit C-6 n=1 Tax=Neltuma alba TaxID=207710 RepID=UPI0010A37DF2|nr:nuclear transcription factor Y subunit C-6-like [Prosopis alba]
MVSAKMSKTEKQINNGGSSKVASKASKPRKEGLAKKNKLGKSNLKDDKVSIFPSSTTEFLEGGKEPGVHNNGATNGRTNGTRPKKGKRKQQGGDYTVEEKENAKMNELPMSRIKRIMKAEDPDLRASEEAIFVISKATVKFLKQFTRESHACSVGDQKKFLGYQRLSGVVGKQRRYDFLLDYVPEKLKAEDALRKKCKQHLGRSENVQ